MGYRATMTTPFQPLIVPPAQNFQKESPMPAQGPLFPALRMAVLSAGAVLLLSSPLSAQNGKDAIPDFMAPGTGWTMINANATDYAPPVSGARPVTNDPKYPHVGNLEPGQKTERVADLTSPILQDWVKPQMQKYNEEVIKGTIPFVATSLC